MSSVRASAAPLWKRVLKNPEKVATTLKMVSAEGLQRTWRVVRQKTGGAASTGYSAAGVVSEVGADINDIVPGDRVACAGAGYANHAEFIRIPRNLCVILPEDVDWDSGSTVTLGAIALQGVRRANPTLGETFVVIGLGILGQLTTQLLRINGCRVIGVDLDSQRIETARQLGMDLALRVDDDDDVNQVARLTGGLGADGAIITAATPSNAVMAKAFGMCRKKGRVVLVGDVGLSLNRADFYEKEIDFLISTSYGPGRYDHHYEEQGLDYPAPYVRWTENRNMEEYVRLLSTGQVQIDPLVSARFPVDEATAAYASVSESVEDRPMIVLLNYPDDGVQSDRTVNLATTRATSTDRIRIAVVGAGSFARSVHLPNLADLGESYVIQSVVARDGSNAAAVAAEFGAASASTDFEGVLEDPDVDAVIIATRHDLHAEMALSALCAGKHVLVEKPLALTCGDVDRLDAFFHERDGESVPLLMTGYNRRFSVFARGMAEFLASRSGPFMMSYRLNAGYISQDHWVQGPEGGGRNLGEACHIYDLFIFLSGAEIETVSAYSINPGTGPYGRTDNFSATVRMSDGSVANLIYTSMGSNDYSKEVADLYVDGNVAVLDDYRLLTSYGTKATTLRTPHQDKGHKEALVRFADGVRTGRWPIPWEQQVQTARLALAINEELLSGS
jgi:predicted dehydrogenase/threonine dehydrogenase-like Zn-dependent dehydrogenase